MKMPSSQNRKYPNKMPNKNAQLSANAEKEKK